MRQFFAAVILVAGVGGTLALWAQTKVNDELSYDEVAMNKKVDARLHTVLVGMLDKERQAHANPALAQVKLRGR